MLHLRQADYQIGIAGGFAVFGRHALFLLAELAEGLVRYTSASRTSSYFAKYLIGVGFVGRGFHAPSEGSCFPRHVRLL